MATKKQDRMYARLRLSSEFSADEVAHWDHQMSLSTSMDSTATSTGDKVAHWDHQMSLYLTTVERAIGIIDAMLDRIDARDQRVHDAAQRKAKFYEKKGA